MIKSTNNSYHRWIIENSDPEQLRIKNSLKQIHLEEAIKLSHNHGVILLIKSKIDKKNIKLNNEHNRLLQDCIIYENVKLELYIHLLKSLVSAVSNQIEYLLLKGFSLNGLLYPDIYMRPLRDLDILIQKQDYNLWKSILLEMELELESPEREKEYLNNNSEIKFVDSKQLIKVELHLDIINSKSLKHNKPGGIETVYENHQLINFQGQLIKIMGIYDLFPYLCCHQVLHHQFDRLIYLIDVLLLIRKYKNKLLNFRDKYLSEWSPTLKACIFYTLNFIRVLYDSDEANEIINHFDLNPENKRIRFFGSFLKSTDIIKELSTTKKIKMKMFREAFK